MVIKISHTYTHMVLSGYINAIYKFKSSDTEIGPVALNILQQFPTKEYLSAYQVYSNLKGTNLEMAYKNVHKRIQRLIELRLIKAQVQKKNVKHGAIYYRLTEDGIYHLFLKGLQGLMFDHVSFKKETVIVPVSKKFVQHYHDNALFKTFLYPYFDKKTIQSANDFLLSDLFYYLHDCCKAVEYHARETSLPVLYRKFGWNSVPGPDNEYLLSSIKEIFDLKDLANATIEKMPYDKNTIQIFTPQNYVSIKLDMKRKKVIATCDRSNRKYYEYDIRESRSDLNIGTITTPEESINKKFKNRKLEEMLVYRLVSELAMSKYLQDSLKILSSDDRFMRLVFDMRRVFNRGYDELMKFRAL
jgi:hypothetical protein